MVSQAVTCLLAVLVVVPLRSGGAQEVPRRLSLEQAVASFAAHSPDLRALRADGDATVGAARAVGVAPNPTLGFTREAIRDGDRRAGETYLTLSQPLRWPWAASARSRVASQARAAADARLAADSLALEYSVRQLYVEAWLAEQRHEVLVRLDAVVRRAEERGVERFAAGDLSGLDRRRLTLERARYDRLLTSARLAEDAARRSLGAAILPTSDSALVAPAGMPDREAVARIGVADALRAGGQHPLVLAARFDLALAELEASAEAAVRTPPPTLTAGYKHQDDGLQGLLVGAALPLPLFDRRGGLREAASARVAAAAARLEQVERRVRDQLLHALARHAAAAEQASQPAAAGLDTDGDLVAIALVAYEEGELDLLDLLATAEAWRELGTLAAQIRAEFWLSRFELERALGGTITSTSTTREGAR